MRKYLIGFIAGLLLASAFPAYGAVTSLIGKQVQAENSVIVNGVELDVKAVNIDGTTYTPNRALAEALGADIGFEDKKVIFDVKEVSETVEYPIDTPEPNPTVDPVQSELDEVNARISELDKEITEYLNRYTQYQFDLLANPDSKEETMIKIKENDENIKPIQEERNHLENRKSELESQLQSQTP